MPMDKVIFVTSIDSFLGQNIAKFYLKKKYRVIAYSNYNFNYYSHKNLIIFQNKQKLKMHLKKFNKLYYFFFTNGIIGSNYKIQKLYKSHISNSNFFLNILKNLKIKRLIFFSSVDEVGFSNKNINENTNYSPSNKYSIIKLLARELFEEFCIKYSKPYTIFRLFLVIGNNQKIPRLFPLIKYHIQNGKKFVINNPLAYKNFIHIDDFCNVLDIILKNKMSLNNIYNLASDQNIKLEKLFKLIHNINPLLKFEKNLNGSLNSQKASIFKIKKIIGNYKFKNINQIIKSFEF